MSASRRSDLFRPEASNERGEGNAESLQGGGELPSPLKNNGRGERAPAERTWNLLPCERSSEWGRGRETRSGEASSPPP